MEPLDLDNSAEGQIWPSSDREQGDSRRAAGMIWERRGPIYKVTHMCGHEAEVRTWKRWREVRQHAVPLSAQCRTFFMHHHWRQQSSGHSIDDIMLNRFLPNNVSSWEVFRDQHKPYYSWARAFHQKTNP